ncbi:phage tail protein [uncultured Psychroserpens sp.]|uniref:phage tail protein n=1 Tax=uncultured Psychroserpens sp. TaxID=255436 RepID=UPI002632FDA0|nr:phage tail protein [uncultured Psychroserpens sp.]
MKRLHISFIFILSMYCCSFAQVGIGTTTPDASAALEITSTDSGILIPRMLVSERISITSPAEGLLVYQTDDVSGFYYYNGTHWVRLMDKSRDGIPTAAIFAFPTATAPTGYLVCDGSAVSRTAYADLFNVIGTTYGNGNGSTTFNLPDYRGQFLRGFDDGSGNDPDAATRTDRGDGIAGNNVGTKQTGAVNSHQHTINAPAGVSSMAGTHQHTIGPFNVNTNTSGVHNHNASFNGNTNAAGSHNHRVYYNNIDADDPPSFGGSVTIRQLADTGAYYDSQMAPSHSHSVSGTVSVGNSGNHNHAIYIPPSSSSSNGPHNHTITLPAFDSATQGGNETRPTNISVVWCIKY